MIKIITGFREDQYMVIENEEAHKAYFLFSNPEARTIFNNGVALIGKDIKGIEPAYNELMGWNPSHRLTGEDWNEIRRSKVDVKMQGTLQEAKRVAILAEQKPEVLKQQLSEAKLLLLS